MKRAVLQFDGRTDRQTDRLPVSLRSSLLSERRTVIVTISRAARSFFSPENYSNFTLVAKKCGQMGDRVAVISRTQPRGRCEVQILALYSDVTSDGVQLLLETERF